ncbi:mtDNA inheritance, partitioning of the mitochondrial organelle [Lithohypha guttulata]|uniref:mtDNA inheritance, partitioning of the mitochondrial organelle n=1 Tax=Lithohypha guttulata TaxID=1690604 RepID=UPI002DDF0091|nr:hypothetical protein LTR51_005256 [Lithohypha guttulata]
MSGAETSSVGELIELVLRSGSAPIPGQPAASSSNEVPDTASTPRRKKTTKGLLTGRGGSSGGTKTRSPGGHRGGGGRTLSRLNTPIKRSGTEDGTSDADECPQPKKSKPDKLPPYIVGIDLGMWGFGRASAPQQSDPANVHARQQWPGVRSKESKAPSMVAFARDNPGNRLFTGNTKELVGFKVTNDMSSVSFFKASLEQRSQAGSFDNPVLRDPVANNLIRFSSSTKDEEAAKAVLKYIYEIEIQNAKTKLKDVFSRTPVITVLTHPAACSFQRKLEDIAKEARVASRRGDKLLLLSESQAAVMAGFVNHLTEAGSEAWKTDFKVGHHSSTRRSLLTWTQEGELVTELDIGSLTTDTTTERVLTNDPTLTLREELRSEGGRCGTIALHLMLLRAIMRKFGIQEDAITPELVGRGSNFHTECEEELEIFGGADSGDRHSFRLSLDQAPDHDDYDEETEECVMSRYSPYYSPCFARQYADPRSGEIDQVIEEWLVYPKQILTDQWVRAQANLGKRVRTTIISGGGSLIEAVFEKLEGFCKNYKWAITAIRPGDAISAVSRGAVISQLCPNLLGERVLRASFGIKLNHFGTDTMKWLESKDNIIDCRKPKVLNEAPGHLSFNLHKMLNGISKFWLNVYMFDGMSSNPLDPDDQRIEHVSQIVLDASKFSQPLRSALEGRLSEYEGDDVNGSCIDVAIRLGVDESGKLYFDAKYQTYVLGKGELRMNVTKSPIYR